jgi:hypothetical protein
MKYIIVVFMALFAISYSREKNPVEYPKEFGSLIGNPVEKKYSKNSLQSEVSYKTLIKYPAEEQLNSFVGGLLKMGWYESGKSPYDPTDPGYTGKWSSYYLDNKFVFTNHHSLKNSNNDFILVQLSYKNQKKPAKDHDCTTGEPDNDTLNVTLQFITEQQSQELLSSYHADSKYLDSLSAAYRRSKNLHDEKTNESIK